MSRRKATKSGRETQREHFFSAACKFTHFLDRRARDDLLKSWPTRSIDFFDRIERLNASDDDE